MPQYIRVQRGSIIVTAINFSATATISAVDTSKAFVRLTHSGPWNGAPNAGTALNIIPAHYYGSVALTNATTVTANRNNFTLDARYYFEVWEYVGPPGGPNEFLVRSGAGTRSLPSGTLSVNDVPPFSYTNIDDVVIFQRGNTIGTGGAVLDSASEMIIPTLKPVLGTVFMTFARGSTLDGVTCNYVAVEFVGSNWFVQRLDLQTVPAPSTDTLIAISDVGSWDNTFITAQRRTADKGIVNHGMVWRPGANTTQVRLHYNAGSQVGAFYETTCWIVSNPEMQVEWKDSVTGGLSDLPSSSGGQPYSFLVSTANVEPTPEEAAVICTINTAGTGTAYPRYAFLNRLLEGPPGTWNVEYWRSRPINTSNFAQAVIRFRPEAIDVEAAEVLEVLETANIVADVPTLFGLQGTLELNEEISPELVQTNPFIVQQGEVTFGASSNFIDVTLNEPVNLSFAAEHLTNMHFASAGPAANSTADLTNRQVGAWCELINTTTLRISRLPSATPEDVVCTWQITEYRGFAASVDEFQTPVRFAVSFGVGDTVQVTSWTTLGLVSPNVDRLMPKCRGIASDTNSTDPSLRLFTVDVDSSGNITVQRAVSGSAATVYFTAMDFVGIDWQLRKAIGAPGGAGFADVPLTTISGVAASVPSWSRAYHVQTMFRYDYSSGDSQSNCVAATVGSNTSNAAFAFLSIATLPVVSGFVLYHRDMTVDRGSATVSAWINYSEVFPLLAPPLAQSVATKQVWLSSTCVASSSAQALDPGAAQYNYTFPTSLTLGYRQTLLKTATMVQAFVDLYAEAAVLPSTGPEINAVLELQPTMTPSAIFVTGLDGTLQLNADALASGIFTLGLDGALEVLASWDTQAIFEVGANPVLELNESVTVEVILAPTEASVFFDVQIPLALAAVPQAEAVVQALVAQAIAAAPLVPPAVAAAEALTSLGITIELTSITVVINNGD